MRPTTPNFNFAQQAGPSSPPATPTTATFSPSGKKARRHGVANFSNFRPPIASTLHSNGGTIIPNGSGTTFSYNRFEPLDLSPRSSSPASSQHSSSASSGADSPSPPRSRSSSPGKPIAESTPNITTRVKVVAEGNFTVEEFRESDYEDFDSDVESIIRPHQYEDAESDQARSARAASPRHELDPRVVAGIRDLECEDLRDERELWLEKLREEKRRKRRSSGSVQKRSLAQSIGSDTDDEDLQPVQFDGANEAGSSARRLRRKVAGERTSLIFDDPPVGRIEEEEEPQSCEELVEFEDGDEDGQCVDREMPFYVQDMEVDSDEE